MRRRAALVATAVLATMLIPVTNAAAVDEVNTKKLRDAVSVNGILKHERALQQIANQNGGTRASGTPGFEASAAYVTKRLTDAGYRVSQQEFEFPFFAELSDPVLETVPATGDFEPTTLEFSPSGDVTGALVPTNDIVIPPTADPSSTSGCEPTDFVPASATEPQVALVQRGTCTFFDKATNAAAAGYDAVAIFNEGQQPDRFGPLDGTLGEQTSIPVVGLSFTDGAALYAAAQAGPLTVHVQTDTVNETRTTKNVIADTPQGNPDKAIVVGAHLDSVLAGPGINDNGSGTATILETALQMSKLHIKPRQQVRFAFWGAEESGLLGSAHYVDSLSPEDLGKIYANLNFDMLGSPNYVRFVYDGDGSATPETGDEGPNGSAQIEAIFNNYFASKGLATAPTAFDGRSDYGPFIAVGIPAGGLFSGAEGIKTAEEAAIFGGTAGEPYDSCYHQACDTTNNLNTKALSEFGDAVADSVLTLARTKSGFFEDGSRMPARKQALSADSFSSHGTQAAA